MGISKNKNTLSTRQQSGATMWTTLSVALMLGFIAMIAFKLIPIYIDHSIIRGSMQEIANRNDFKQLTPKQILVSIQKRMQIDNIRGFSKDAFKLGREKSGKRFIIIKYSQQVSIAGNVSALVEFDEEIHPGRN